MKRFTKLVWVLALALMATAAIGGTASASNGIETNRTLQRWGGRLTFAGSGFRVVCTVLREYRFHRLSHTKVLGTLVGLANIIIVPGSCSGGNVVVLGREFHMRYEGFTGSLPTPNPIYTLDYTTGGFLVEAFFGLGQCLYSGTGRGRTVNTRGSATEIRVDESVVTAPLHEELSPISCPSGTVAGVLTPLAGPYTIRLI